MKLVNIKKDIKIKIDKELYSFLDPDYIYLPRYDNELHVKQNGFVYKGDIVIGKKKKITSSVSGKAIGVNKYLLHDDSIECVVIENDFREKTEVIKKIKKTIEIEDILKAIEKKDDMLFTLFKSLKTCDNIVINAIHDEPYVMNYIMSLKENINDILDFVDNLGLLYKSKNMMIVVKNTESDIIDECLNVIGTYPNIKITLMNDEYLLGKKEFLLSKLKIDMNKTLYLNIEDLVRLIKLVRYNKESSTKIITISGDAIEIGKVIKVKKYTLLKDIIDKYIKIIADDYVMVVNNLLNGDVVTEQLVITDEISSIHIMKKEYFDEKKCIRCGKCVAVCPVMIDPVHCMKKKKSDARCIDCGLCSYVCPSFIPLRKYVTKEKK